MWSRVDWVVDTSDQLWYCTTHYNAANETTAMQEHPDHDHSEYANYRTRSRCGCDTKKAVGRPLGHLLLWLCLVISGSVLRNMGLC